MTDRTTPPTGCRRYSGLLVYVYWLLLGLFAGTALRVFAESTETLQRLDARRRTSIPSDSSRAMRYVRIYVIFQPKQTVSFLMRAKMSGALDRVRGLIGSHRNS